MLRVATELAGRREKGRLGERERGRLGDKETGRMRGKETADWVPVWWGTLLYS